MDLSNRVVLITGASSGIGKALALALAKRRCQLILAARRLSALAEVQAACKAFTPDCEIFPLDLEDSCQISAKIDQAIAFFGHIDILVNNAGISQRGSYAATPIAIDRKIMEVNFFGAVALTKALLPHFQQRGSGHIVAISSMVGEFGFPMRSAYAASKHALQGFFETMQVENTIPRLHVTIVCPGRINTPISFSAITPTGEQYGKMDQGQAKGIPVTRCAEKIVRAIERNKRKIYIAREERLLLFFKKFLPPLFYTIARRLSPN